MSPSKTIKSWLTQCVDPLAMSQVLKDSLTQPLGDFSLLVTFSMPSTLMKSIMVKQAKKIANMS